MARAPAPISPAFQWRPAAEGEAGPDGADAREATGSRWFVARRLSTAHVGGIGSGACRGYPLFGVRHRAADRGSARQGKMATLLCNHSESSGTGAGLSAA